MYHEIFYICLEDHPELSSIYILVLRPVLKIVQNFSSPLFWNLKLTLVHGFIWAPERKIKLQKNANILCNLFYVCECVCTCTRVWYLLPFKISDFEENCFLNNFTLLPQRVFRKLNIFSICFSIIDKNGIIWQST